MRQYALGELTTEDLQRFVAGQVKLLAHTRGVGFLIRRGAIKSIAISTLTLIIELEWMAQNIGDFEGDGVSWVYMPAVRYEFDLRLYTASDLALDDPMGTISRVILYRTQTLEAVFLHPPGDPYWLDPVMIQPSGTCPEPKTSRDIRWNLD